MPKERFYLCVSGNHFGFEDQTSVILIKINMTHKFINSKSCRNQKLYKNEKHKYRKDVILAAIFGFPIFALKDTMQINFISNIFEFSK